MSEEIKNEGQTTGTTQPEVNGAPTGKTFTQEEVNKIVSDRLAKERAKQEPQADPAAEQLAQREKELAARENKLTCAEYIKKKGLDDTLVDIFDTGDIDKFKSAVDKLLELYPATNTGNRVTPVVYGASPVGTVTAHPGEGGNVDPIAQAFRRK